MIQIKILGINILTRTQRHENKLGVISITINSLFSGMIFCALIKWRTGYFIRVYKLSVRIRFKYIIFSGTPAAASPAPTTLLTPRAIAYRRPVFPPPH